jgi:cytochrome c biogenesis protein
MNNFIRRISDLKTSLLLLSLLIISSLIGSTVDQSPGTNTSISVPNNLVNSDLLVSFSEVSSFFGFSHIFSTGWFLVLNTLIAISLLTCTVTQQLPSFDFCRSINFLRGFLDSERFDAKLLTSQKFFPEIIFQLLEKNYIVFQKSKACYTSKGLIARIGPLFVHLSLIFIFLGGLMSAISGFTAQEFIPKGEISYLTNIPDSNLFDYLPSYPVRINDFWISHLPNKLIYQFYTNLSSLNSFGKETNNFTISVNHPFSAKDIIWYQTDWDVIGLNLQSNDFTYQIPVNQLTFANKKLWISWLPFFNQTEPIFFEDLRGELILVSNISSLTSYIELGQSLQIGSNFTFKFLDILTCTGLQVHYDPGNLFLCLGFVNLIVSTFLSYLSYSRIWVLKQTDLLLLGGLTNRAKLKFELEFIKLFENLFAQSTTK